LGLRGVVNVLPGRGDVGVTHSGLDVGDRELPDGHRAEAVAKVVEAERAEAGALLGSAVATRQLVVVENRAGVAREHLALTRLRDRDAAVKNRAASGALAVCSTRRITSSGG
jgi:hypothetical protein